MPINRRTFLSNSALLSGGLMLSKERTVATSLEKPSFPIPSDFSLKILATNWGYEGEIDTFCAEAKKAGYDGVEVWFPWGEKREAFFKAVEKYELEYAFLSGAWETVPEKHFVQYEKNISEAVKHKALFINCHAGKDYFNFEQNKRVIEYANRLSKETGVPILQETHRSRMLFAAHLTHHFIQQIPDLRLTLDISHWCNVHESLLADQPEAVAAALSRTDHIHARIGHAESPQISDLQAPEWSEAVKAHFAWWDQVVEMKVKAKQALTVTTEFGPPHYMPVIPYTGQAIADNWKVNIAMMKLLRERYQ